MNQCTLARVELQKQQLYVVPGRMVAAHRKTFKSTASGEWRIYIKQKIRTAASLQVGRIGSKLIPILHLKTPIMSSQSGTGRPGDSLLPPQSDARSVEELTLLYAVIEYRIVDVLLVWVRLQLNLAAHNMSHVNIKRRAFECLPVLRMWRGAGEQPSRHRPTKTPPALM